MRLVLFDDALDHLTRLHRVLRMPQGHALLVGVGGSGKQSITRLASFAAECEVFEITLSRGYSENSFRDDLKVSGVVWVTVVNSQRQCTRTLNVSVDVVESIFSCLTLTCLCGGVLTDPVQHAGHGEQAHGLPLHRPACRRGRCVRQSSAAGAASVAAAFPRNSLIVKHIHHTMCVFQLTSCTNT